MGFSFDPTTFPVPDIPAANPTSVHEFQEPIAWQGVTNPNRLLLSRNTVNRSYNHLAFKQQVYAVPRANPPLVKMPTDPTLSSTTATGGEDDTDHDYVEPPLELASEDEEDSSYYRVPRALQSSMSDTTSNRFTTSSLLLSPPPPKTLSEEKNQAPTTHPDSAKEDLIDHSRLGKTDVSPPMADDDGGGDGVYERMPEESPYEMESGAFTNTNGFPSDPVYQNADDALAGTEVSRGSRSNSSELLNITSSTGGTVGRPDTASPLSPVSITTSPPPSSSTGQSCELQYIVCLYTAYVI